MNETVIDPRFRNRERQPGLDLLRALAIIVVVIYHAALFGFKLPGRIDRFGWIGVDLFFVLSGYLIGGQLLAPLARNQRINLGRFFARRAFRIMPAYFVVLAIYFLLPSWREYPEMSQPLWKFLLSVQNIGLHGGTAFSHAWSLAVEDQFYLLLPFILLFVNRWPPGAMIVPFVIVFGGIALRAEKFQRQWWKRLMDLAIWLWLPALGLIAFALYLGESENLTVTVCIWQFPFIAVGMAALLICAISTRLPFCRIAIPGAAFIASIAYSTYLIQKLVMHQVLQLLHATPEAVKAGSTPIIALTSVWALVLVEVCVYTAATLLFLAVERPFLQLRKRLAPRKYALQK